MIVKFRRVHTYAVIPTKSTSGAACYDAYLPATYEPLMPGEIRIIKLGFEVEVPYEYELQVRPRSGLASKGIYVSNSPGCIDSDFRGECGVILHNMSNAIQPLTMGDRICQLKLSHAPSIEWEIVDELDCTDIERDPQGFGSSVGTSDQLHG